MFAILWIVLTLFTGVTMVLLACDRSIMRSGRMVARWIADLQSRSNK